MRLHTIGFTKKDARTFFGTLSSAGVRRVVDVRLNNVSQLAGFTRRDDLAFFLRAVSDIDYIHLLDFAPEAGMLKAYRDKAMSWPEYADAYLSLLEARDVKSGALLALREGDCLLCSEPTPEKCHRRLAAEYAQSEVPGVDIRHL